MMSGADVAPNWMMRPFSDQIVLRRQIEDRGLMTLPLTTKGAAELHAGAGDQRFGDLAGRPSMSARGSPDSV